jgi:hypothetical protein
VRITSRSRYSVAVAARRARRSAIGCAGLNWAIRGPGAARAAAITLFVLPPSVITRARQEAGARLANASAIAATGVAAETKIGAVAPALPASAAVVDRARRERALEVRAAPAHADDLPDRPRALERERERRADQPDADDDELLDRDGHNCAQALSAAASAVRNRSFSAARPTVTRKWSGMP